MMNNPYHVRVKICCIRSIKEAELAIKYGASAIGFVSEMPSGPGVINEGLIAEIARAIPPGIASFLLTSKQDAESIIEQQKRTGVNTLQICDRIISGTYNDLRSALPGIGLVQVIHVNGEESVDEAMSAAQFVNALLLDSGNQNLPIKELGGTGRTHNWNISKKISESISIPLYLAGGLNSQNVSDAIDIVKPFGVDICSGVRTNGSLDEHKLQEFFQSVLRS